MPERTRRQRRRAEYNATIAETTTDFPMDPVSLKAFTAEQQDLIRLVDSSLAAEQPRAARAYFRELVRTFTEEKS